VLAAVHALLAQSKERRRQIARTWIPLWVLFAVSVIWFALLKFEVLESNVPAWIGWVSIIAIAVWCFISVFQVKLESTVKESVFLTAKTSAMVCWLFVGPRSSGGVCAARGRRDHRALGAVDGLTPSS
jgi:TRAP-type mannitol/chloroaromatic compound transport system permease large subunit